MAPAPRARPSADCFEARLAAADAVLHNQDNREHDLLDSDDYYQFEGGLARRRAAPLGTRSRRSTTTTIRGPSRPRIRTLREEIGRVVRGRAANPRWIAGVMRHGYKGAFEIAATVDYLFAFAATARAVDDHHFDALYDAYLGDDAVRDFIAAHNPAALAEIEPPLRRGDRARPVAAAPQQRRAPSSPSWRSGRMSDAAETEDEINRAPPREDGAAARRRAPRCSRPRPRSAASLIVHTGTGKGKSTAAFGMVLRCIGHGMRVGVVQFVKGVWGTGERAVLGKFPELVTCRAMGEGFTWDTQDRARDIAAARAAWDDGARR